MLDDEDARELLKSLKAPKELVDHCETVRDVCMEVIELLKERNPGIKINKRLVSVGALLHDIGRTKTQGIEHGVVGGQIIRGLNVTGSRELEKIARICERHIGGGITREEAKRLGLPPGEYIPRTIEEKLVAYCDNMVDDVKGSPVVRDPTWAVVEYEKRHGKNSDAARMVRDLNQFFEKLLGG